jgi:hypothetical protein
MSSGKDKGVWTEFTHGGNRWSFDGDELALWDEEDGGFQFHAYHGLNEPTEADVIAFIEQQ